MAKRKRTGRRLSGNPAKAVEQLRTQQADAYFRREVPSQPVPAYRSPSAADWARLEREAHTLHPACPECGGRLLGSTHESGEEGADNEGNTMISMVLWCENVEDDDTGKRTQIPHPSTHGMIEHELVLPSFGRSG